jgi:hypothetical protein
MTDEGHQGIEMHAWKNASKGKNMQQGSRDYPLTPRRKVLRGLNPRLSAQND